MIPLHKVWMSRAVDGALKQTLHSGFIGQGPKVDAFEQALAPYVGRKTLLTVNSCTSALHLALRLCDLKPGDEVISTPMTCAATNIPILASGATLVWADVDPWTGNIDPQSIEKRITRKTRAVMVVHYGGRPCDLNAIQRLCNQHGLKLIEDAAHAFGASYNGQPIGSHGDFVCFSFQAIKPLTTGDGGLLSCKSQKDYDRAKRLRWYGMDRPADLKRDVPEWGYKFHMNDLNAALGLANLDAFPANLRARRRNADFYADHLTRRVYHPDSANYLFLIHSLKRTALQKTLHRAGIASGVVHERNDRYSMFKASRCALPGVDSFTKTQLAIPVGPWVSLSDCQKIVQQCV